MAKIIQAHLLMEQKGQYRHWSYNGADCCYTREILDVLLPRLDDITRQTYLFEMSCQSSALSMSLRGIRIDDGARTAAIHDLRKDEKTCELDLQTALTPVWDALERRKGKCSDGKPHKWPKDIPDASAVCGKCGKPRLVAAAFNPRSVLQVKKALYGRLGMPVQISRKTQLPTVDDEALEKLALKFPANKPIITKIQDARTVRKQIGFLNSRLGVDGRMRAAFNVGAAETGRWSSSKNPYMEGTNFQNIADRSRNIFIADPGMVLFYADLEQAESRCVAYDAEDLAYIAAHDSGDVHTTVAKLLWPKELPWTGDLNLDKKVAETKTPWDEFHDYRHYAKIVQHGTNIGMTPVGIARQAHIKILDAQDVQKRYFDAFPGVYARQQAIRAEVLKTGCLITPLRRKRLFFGRLWDESTMKEALAQTQQSMIGDILNVALQRVDRQLDLQAHVTGRVPSVYDTNSVWCLAQVHDAILGEIRRGDNDTLRRVKELMQIPVSVRGRTMEVPVEILIGNHWRCGKPKWQSGDMIKWDGTNA